MIYITQLFDEIIARLINFRIIRSEKLKKSGLLMNIYNHPKTDYTRNLIDAIPGRASE